MRFVSKLDQRNYITSPKLFLLEKFQNSHVPATFMCENGHVRMLKPYTVVARTPVRCAECTGKAPWSSAKFIEHITKNTSWEIQEPKQTYTMTQKIPVKCPKGHVRMLTPDLIVHQNVGCAVCSRKIKKTLEGFKVELDRSHNVFQREPFFVVDNQSYTNNYTSLSFICTKAHEWKATPTSVLRGTGCPYCIRATYSQSALRWLKVIEQQHNVKIQHAENGGEYKISNTNFRVDGFDPTTNTVYEYYGDKFHGNLNRFKPNEKCHPFDPSVTALELFERTIRREQILIDLGYNLVTQWEYTDKQRV